MTRVDKTNEAIRARLEHYLRRTEMGYAERFDSDAEQFYRETGFMAPGKSMPLEMYQGEAHEARRQDAWNEWVVKMGRDFCALLRDAVDALSSSSVVSPSREWQPIETAPKDGTQIVCAWPTRASFEFEIAVWGINENDDGWFDEDGGTWFDCEGNELCPPTHWMPMPQAPALLDPGITAGETEKAPR